MIHKLTIAADPEAPYDRKEAEAWKVWRVPVRVLQRLRTEVRLERDTLTSLAGCLYCGRAVPSVARGASGAGWRAWEQRDSAFREAVPMPAGSASSLSSSACTALVATTATATGVEEAKQFYIPLVLAALDGQLRGWSSVGEHSETGEQAHSGGWPFGDDLWGWLAYGPVCQRCEAGLSQTLRALVLRNGERQPRAPLLLERFPHARRGDQETNKCLSEEDNRSV